MRKEGHFYYWICNLMQKSPFFEVKKIFQKRLLAIQILDLVALEFLVLVPAEFQDITFGTRGF